MADEPWNHARDMLRAGVRDLEATRALRMDLEILPGVRRDDPAQEIIYQHARGLYEEIGGLRELQESFREAAQRRIEEERGWLSGRHE